MRQGIVRWIAVASAVAVVVVDQSAKAFAAGAHTAAIQPVRNPGLALGAFRAPPLVLVLGVIAVMAVFLGVVGRWAVQVGISPVIPGVIAGGSLAHAFDRVQFGAVRDFIATPWLVIDVADIAVIAGILALGFALALRIRALRATARTIAFDVRTLRPVVVPVRSG